MELRREQALPSMTGVATDIPCPLGDSPQWTFPVDGSSPNTACSSHTTGGERRAA
jgi:hypothetical protein